MVHDVVVSASTATARVKNIFRIFIYCFVFLFVEFSEVSEMSCCRMSEAKAYVPSSAERSVAIWKSPRHWHCTPEGADAPEGAPPSAMTLSGTRGNKILF